MIIQDPQIRNITVSHEAGTITLIAMKNPHFTEVEFVSYTGVR